MALRRPRDEAFLLPVLERLINAFALSVVDLEAAAAVNAARAEMFRAIAHDEAEAA